MSKRTRKRKPLLATPGYMKVRAQIAREATAKNAEKSGEDAAPLVLLA
jgi:hypothetical protein